MTDAAFDPAIFALGSDTHLVEQQARQIQAEANAIAARAQTSSAAVGAEEKISHRHAKDRAHNCRHMDQHRRDAALLSENAAMRVDFRATLEDRMKSAVCDVVAPRPPASPYPSSSVDGIAAGGGNEANANNISVNGMSIGGANDEDGNNEADDLMIISTTTTTTAADGAAASSSNYPDPLKYIARRRQELAKRKASIQSGAGQVNAALQRARTADAKDAALKEKMAQDGLLQRKVDQDREVENRRRELEGTKRREAGLAETSRVAHARYLANGMAIAEKNADHMAKKRENQDIETDLANTLNTLEEEIAKTISTKISAVEARITSLSGQLDHIHRQHGEVQQLRADLLASIEAAKQVKCEEDQAKEVNETLAAELLLVETKVKTAEDKMSGIVKAQEDADQTQAAIAKEEQDKVAAIEAEKAQLLQKREALTGLLVRMQQGGSTQDAAETGKTETEQAARDAERKAMADNIAEKKDLLQAIDASIAARRAQALKDEQYEQDQTSNLQRTKTVTLENVASLRDAIDAKKRLKDGSKKTVMDSIRKAFDEKRALFDLLLGITRSGKNLLIDSNDRTEEVMDRPVKIEEEGVEEEGDNLSPQDVILSTEAAPSPSQSQRNPGRSRSARRRRSGVGVGSSRRRIS